jgi:FKBP-type peptidyl-prolyl cis-trans isomerase
VPPVVNHDPELAELKAKVDHSHGAYLKKQEDIRLAKRAALEAEIDRLCNHVRERMAEMDFNAELARKQKEKVELDRLNTRAEDRLARREKRFEEYMEAERQHMMYEDSRSYQVCAQGHGIVVVASVLHVEAHRVHFDSAPNVVPSYLCF